MSVLLAVVAVGLGSLALRLAPLVSRRRAPLPLVRGAGWAGLAVIAGLTVRATALHDDPRVAFGPLVALMAVVVCFVVAFRGRSVLLAVGAGCAAYVVAGALLGSLG